MVKHEARTAVPVCHTLTCWRVQACRPVQPSVQDSVCCGSVVIIRNTILIWKLISGDPLVVPSSPTHKSWIHKSTKTN